MFSLTCLLRSSRRGIDLTTIGCKRWLSSDLRHVKQISGNQAINWSILCGQYTTVQSKISTFNKPIHITGDLLKNIVAIKEPIVLPISLYLPNSSASSTTWKINEPKEKPVLDLPSKTEVVKMYLDYRIIKDPRSYTHLTVIRRRKMNKHKRIKWRKKMLAFLKKKFLKRNIKTEKVFRAELLAQIKEAEEFNAEKYVRDILETIDNTPKRETGYEKIQRIRELIRKNRRETNYMPPKFDD